MPGKRIHGEDHYKHKPGKAGVKVQHQQELKRAQHSTPIQLAPDEAVWEARPGEQAQMLAGTQLLSAQRSSLAVQVAQVQGNRRFGQVLSNTGLNGQADASSSRLIQRVDGGTVHPMIRRGSRGPDVEEAQTKLNSAGATPPLAVDGIFGPLTQAATVQFQTANELEPDGIIGPLTWAALDAGGGGTEVTGTDGGGTEETIERWSDADTARLAAQTSDTGPLNVYQASRAQLRVYALSEGDYNTFRSILNNAGSDMEWAFLLKAAAAQRSISDISTFADRIRGMSERWLMRNLMVVDLVNDLSPGADPEERGIMQQYGNSCGPTSLQLIHAQADPIYALELRSGGPIDVAPDTAVSNPESISNQRLAGEQADILNAHVATGTGNAPTNRTAGGGGAWVEEDINALSAATGATYETKIIGTDITMDAAISELQGGLASGVQVPIIVGGGSGPSNTSHYVVVLIASGDRFLVHDVATGDTIWRTETDFRNHTLNLPSGWNYFVAIDVPSLVPPPLPEAPTSASE
jgi:peptidoglycan hydrolase-like protein with peptidoglycan-binding domain